MMNLQFLVIFIIFNISSGYASLPSLVTEYLDKNDQILASNSSVRLSGLDIKKVEGTLNTTRDSWSTRARTGQHIRTVPKKMRYSIDALYVSPNKKNRHPKKSHGKVGRQPKAGTKGNYRPLFSI